MGSEIKGLGLRVTGSLLTRVRAVTHHEAATARTQLVASRGTAPAPVASLRWSRAYIGIVGVSVCFSFAGGHRWGT